MATVAHYMNHVRIYKDNPLITTSKLPQFITYLVTRSWRKMHRRIRHWSSQGFIYYLGQVDEATLRDAVQPVSPLRNDSSFSVRLMGMDRKNIIRKFVTTTSTGMPLAITSLLTSCRDMEMMPRREGLEKEDEVSGLYNKTTCFEFHQLLVSILLSFGKALDGYADAHGKKRFEDLVDRAEEVYECGTLLWFIGYSRILRSHLKVLREEGWLHLPANSKEDLDKFSDFTKFKKTKDQVIVQPIDEVNGDADGAGSSDESGVDDCGDEGGEDEDERAAKDQVIVQPTDEVDGGANEAGNNGEDGTDDRGNEGGEDEDEEFENIADTVVSSGLSKSFLDWIRLQVDRFQAARKITSFMKRTRTPPIALTLLAVRVPTPKPAGEVMEPWHETIKNLCVKSKNVKPEETIRILQEKIDKGKRAINASCDDEKKKTSIFHKFDAETYQYDAAVHCEAALASMEKYPSAVVCDDALKAHIQVWFHFRYHRNVYKSDALHRISTTAQ